MLRRWLDPPEVIARKRLVRAARGSGHSGDDRQFEIGCLVPLALTVAVLVGIGVLISMGLQRAAPASPDHIVVRVIDSGASPGPQVLATAIVPLR